MFLPFMSHLHILEIYVNPYSTTIGHFDILTFLILSLHASSSSPATLEHLKFSITILVDENMLDNDGFYDNLYSDNVWRHLDSITIHPTGSQLQRVEVDIKFCYDNDDDTVDTGEDVLEPIFDELPLLREKGILFVHDHGVESSVREKETV